MSTAIKIHDWHTLISQYPQEMNSIMDFIWRKKVEVALSQGTNLLGKGFWQNTK